jgi:hypothetical protein
MATLRKTLADIASIRSGYQFRGRVEECSDGNVRVIQMKDISEENVLDEDSMARVQVDAPERYLVSQGDVLFVSRGRNLTATEIVKPLEGVIATSYYFILTPDTKLILSGFLAWSINQSRFQKRLGMVTNTTSIPWVSRADIEELTIELPPIAVQQQILELTALQVKQKTLALRLIERREQLVTAICDRLASGQIAKKV